MNALPARAGFAASDWIAIAALNLMWGLNLIAVKMSVDLVEPLTAALLRQVMVLVICLPALKLVPGRMRELLTLGLLSGALFYIIVNLSMAVSTNVGALAIAGQLGAPFSLILAVFVLKEQIHAARIVGIFLAFAGVFILAFDPHALDERLGLLLSTLGSLIWAVCSLIQRRLAGVKVLTIYAWVGLMGSLVLLPIAAVFEPEAFASIPAIPLATLGWILFSALGSTVIGQGAMSWLLARHTISTVVPMTLINPVIAVIASAWWFKTPITLVMALGGVLVMAGVAIITIRTAKAREAAISA